MLSLSLQHFDHPTRGWCDYLPSPRVVVGVKRRSTTRRRNSPAGAGGALDFCPGLGAAEDEPATLDDKGIGRGQGERRIVRAVSRLRIVDRAALPLRRSA